MIIVDNVILSDDIMDEFFVCNLEACKGACCVEGDLGAPLTEEELPVMDKITEEVKEYLSEKGLKEIEKQGPYIKDFEGDYSTTTINNRECAFAVYDENNHLQCGIELAWKDGKTQFQKPVSCHLYPIRIDKYQEYDAVNYHRWDICSPACGLGKSLGVPLYQFLKDALIRKYGESWYNKLLDEICLREKEGIRNIRKEFTPPKK